jgi:hypothetical protein
MGGPKMDFGQLAQSFRALVRDQFLGRGFHFCGYTPPEPQSERFALAIKPIDESLPGQDRSRGHRHVRLGFRSLLEFNFTAVLH